MNYLIDTHVFLWLSLSPERLSEQARRILENRENSIFLSKVSIWEIQIKQQLGKLSLALPLETLVTDEIQTNQLQLLSIETHHIYGLSALEQHHRDPFDRLIISQARQEEMPLISADQIFSQYPVQLIW